MNGPNPILHSFFLCSDGFWVKVSFYQIKNNNGINNKDQQSWFGLMSKGIFLRFHIHLVLELVEFLFSISEPRKRAQL